MFFKAYLLGIGSCITQALIGKFSCKVKDNIFEIVDLEIDEYYRNQGYGSVLLKEIIGYAKSFSISRIRGDIYKGDTDNDDKKARLYHFYEKHGFVVDGNRLILIIK